MFFTSFNLDFEQRQNLMKQIKLYTFSPKSEYNQLLLFGVLNSNISPCHIYSSFLQLSTNDDLQIPSGSNKKTVIPAHKQRKAFKDSVPSENSSPSSVERMRCKSAKYFPTNSFVCFCHNLMSMFVFAHSFPWKC